MAKKEKKIATPPAKKPPMPVTAKTGAHLMGAMMHQKVTRKKASRGR